MSAPNIFLVGAERSGTTVLRLMLDHHPQITWLNEFEYAIDRVTDGGAFPDVSEYIDWLEQHRIFKATGFQADRTLDYLSLVRGFLTQRQSVTGKFIIGASVHRHFGRLLTLFPDARFIHIVRDPRDVAPSVIKMGWAGNVYTACKFWVEAEQCWNELASRIDEDRFVQIRYEDLLSQPTKELKKACDLIGVAYDEQMLAYHENTSYSPLDASASQRWKKTLDAKKVALIESRCAPILAARGYACADPAPAQPTGLKLLALKIQSRLVRSMSRIHRYGFAMWARAAIAKRFSPNGAYPRIKAQMDEIMQSNLK